MIDNSTALFEWGLIDENSTAPTRGQTGDLDNPLSRVYATILVVICVATLFFNLSLIYIIFRTKALHTSTNCFIVSMTLSDLLVGACVMPVAVACRLQEEWIFSAVFCQVTGVINSVGSSVTILSMAGVAIDRYVAVSRPLKYSNIMSSMKTGAMLVIIWVQSLVFAIIPVFGLGTYEYDKYMSTCSLSLGSHSGFFYIKFVACVFLPCVIISVTLLLIFKSAKSHHRIFTALPLPFTMPLSGTPSVVNYKRSTMKAMRALFFIVLSYVVLWTPYTILAALQLRGISSMPAELLVTSGFLSYASSAINPLIITALNKKFKEKFFDMICCLKICCKKDNRVGPGHVERQTHVTGIPSAYDTRASRSHVIAPANETAARLTPRPLTRPIVRLHPPTPTHNARRHIVAT